VLRLGIEENVKITPAQNTTGSQRPKRAATTGRPA
jgi:hypothetical protein